MAVAPSDQRYKRMNENDRVSYWFNEVLAKANGNALAECATDPFNFHLSGGPIRRYPRPI